MHRGLMAVAFVMVLIMIFSPSAQTQMLCPTDAPQHAFSTLAQATHPTVLADLPTHHTAVNCKHSCTVQSVSIPLLAFLNHDSQNAVIDTFFDRLMPSYPHEPSDRPPKASA